MALISDLNNALRASDHAQAIKICTDLLAITEYPATLRTYASDILRQLGEPLEEEDRSRSLGKRLVCGSFFEEFEERYTKDTYVKLFAFYLPQFHRIPENDLWWGDGFTEWSNTSKSKVRFDGHYQPRIPHDSIGYYDLSEASTLERQAELAQKANINGFCFYYYWFAGKRLLETPIENLYANPHIPLEYVICWANENWTRKWDGLDHHILIGQDYNKGWEIGFIQDVAKFFSDPRYVRLNGDPVLIVYKLLDIPDPERVISSWRDWCANNGIGKISVWAVYDVQFTTLELPYIDRFIEFPPRQVGALKKLDEKNYHSNASDFHLYDYKTLVESITHSQSIADSLPFPIYRTAMMSWDNSARRQEGFSVWVNYSIDRFYAWCRHIWQYTIDRQPVDERFIFINAWNEWAEGTYLEPDQRFGFANINALSRAMAHIPSERRPCIFRTGLNNTTNLGQENALQKKISVAVHLHLYYIDAIDQIYSYLENIPVPFDLYLTIVNPKVEELVSACFAKVAFAKRVNVIHVPNIGMDIAPFLIELVDYVDQYDVLLHLHGKRSGSVWWGHLWREYLLDHCLGSPEHVANILTNFADNATLGLVSPPIYPPLKPHAGWGDHEQMNWCQDFLDRLFAEADAVPSLPDTPYFPAGSFYWVRASALKPLFAMKLTYEKFKENHGESNYRLEHVIERVLPYVVRNNTYNYETFFRYASSKPTETKTKRLCIYVSYTPNSHISAEALHYIQSLHEFVDELVFVSNSPIHSDQQSIIAQHCSRLIVRDNLGYDFGAWRDALQEIGDDNLNQYDELVLANSSCLGPFVPWNRVFSSMESEQCDFWGLTIFPEISNSNRPEAQSLSQQKIPRHIQSFFMVFKKHVFQSSAFKGFWYAIADEDKLLNVVVGYETQLTRMLESYGFKCSAYCKGHEAMQSHNNDCNYNAIYNQPYDLLLLGSPVIKNKFEAMWPGQIQLVKEYIVASSCYPVALSSHWH
ncbi:MAG: hypothetical protein RLZZ117_439 [Cyanobacteriota bacterium]|jgi:lipopolysaccharide biosynthesis protein